ncbi:MAG: hypothetical protein HOU81_15745 [Hamadaea sp.]|uniref:hypothetical protein n=1 Tax=Hamadaea sp. TaxID=2024425 RepID=UPI001794D4A7|nr:hypothetical protein [Hamadaea sp.]NUR72266.1 hypothetical protein [Hamadaea sp.]NUT23222.1 hypothetical protein [Hamadaea sp.]
MDARLKFFGFYADLPYVAGAAVSADELLAEPHPADDKSRVVAYLQGGAPITVVPGFQRDPRSDRELPGGASVYTDGEWAWPHIAAYLVERYDLAVPAEFAEHMRARGFEPATPDRRQVIDLFHEHQGMLSPRPEPPLPEGAVRLSVLLVKQVEDTGKQAVVTIAADLLTGALPVGAQLTAPGSTEPLTVAGIRLQDGPAEALAEGQKGIVRLRGAAASALRGGDVLTA